MQASGFVSRSSARLSPDRICRTRGDTLLAFSAQATSSIRPVRLRAREPRNVCAHYERGPPIHNERKHFEVLVLSGAQAGLSWSLVLKKREGYRRAFDKFDPDKVAHYSERQIQKLISDPEIIRNRMKIEAAVRNARAFLKS